MKEFAEKGYKNASTNKIVKEAEISKGLLFHYFKNKKELFLFLYDLMLEKGTEEFYKKIDLIERDIIKRLHQMGMIKLEMTEIYPDMFKFLQNAYFEKDEEIKMELEERHTSYFTENYAKLFDDIDVEKFKDGVDVQKAIKMMLWTFDGMSNVELETAKQLGIEIDYERVFKEADEYIEMFKKCFYK
jgi:AcrR family transcriptional regulator